MEQSVLLTGFCTYVGTLENPAEAVVNHLGGEPIGGTTVHPLVVDNTYDVCVDEVCDAIGRLDPGLVIMLGEYPGRSMITVERIATNYNDSARYGLEDNAGVSLCGRPTVPDGPAAYFATVPVKRMVAAMRTDGVPADVSDTAATFVCNHLMYGVLHHLAVNHGDIRAGWIHLPPLPSSSATDRYLNLPSMSVETSSRGVRAAIAAALEHDTDLETSPRSRFQV
jgi:pyroglutamyl-peptidase